MALFTNKELYSFWEECKQTQCSTDLVLLIFLPDTAVHFIKKQAKGLHTKNETSETSARSNPFFIITDNC